VPTVFRSGPYRFYFNSADGAEPPQVHVTRGGRAAIFWLDPVRVRQSAGLDGMELAMLAAIVQDNVEALRRSWDDLFGD
jgi:hypothetical protein